MDRRFSDDFRRRAYGCFFPPIRTRGSREAISLVLKIPPFTSSSLPPFTFAHYDKTGIL